MRHSIRRRRVGSLAIFLDGGGYGGDGGIWWRSTAEEILVKGKWEKMGKE